MLVKNIETNVTESLRYGPAMDAVTAGTHTIVNGHAVGASASSEAKASLDALTKDELLAKAKERGVEVKASDTKADIIKALEAK